MASSSNAITSSSKPSHALGTCITDKVSAADRAKRNFTAAQEHRKPIGQRQASFWRTSLGHD
jgi:hypothetical protein